MSARAVRVGADWLVLREPADAAARSVELVERLAPELTAGDLVVHDLGGGSGAMGRWLAPRLPGRQHWVVHDRDAALLELAVADPPPSVTVEARQSDLAALTPADLAGASLVTASALLDMLTRDELAAMLGACTPIGCPLLIAMTVVGRVALTPADPLDAEVAAAFNDHQRREGRLGPDAVSAAVDQLRATGAEVIVRPSPWHLGPAHAALIAKWLPGWIAAAGEQDPTLGAAYGERRLAQAAANELAVTVDHADLLVLA
jgi:trans-aconitate methyltransferase